MFSDMPVVARCPEAAKCLRLSKRTVWQMGKDGVIRIEKVGRSVLYYVREFFERRLNDHGQPD
jgi:excisionase family DNA binding protein